MAGLSFAYRDGTENDLTPLGERRRKLPLQRKVKQVCLVSNVGAESGLL